MNRAVFLDRDHTLIEDPGYLSDPDAVKLLPGVELAIKSLHQAGYKIVVCTNQSAIARGILTEESQHGWDITGGHSHICDYKGDIISSHIAGTDSFCSAMVDIAALRDFRDKSLFGNWLKDMRTEQYKVIYEEPIFPKNLFLETPPPLRAERQELHRQSIRNLQERGVWKRPKE